MKKFYFLLFVLLSFSFVNSVNAQIIISQVYEKGNDNWVEITNIGSTNYDFSVNPVTLGQWSNKPTASGNPSKKVVLSGIIEPGKSILYKKKTSNASQSAKNPAYALDNSLNFVFDFNGKGPDPLALYSNDDPSQIIDLFNPNNYEDDTWIRKETVKNANATYTETEWLKENYGTALNAVENTNARLGYHAIQTSASTETDITEFIINSVNGVLDQENHTVTIELPYGSTKTNLTPSITVSQGASINKSGSQDFTNNVTYTVTAEDGTTTQDWVVSVTIAGPPSPQVSFKIESASIQEGAQVNTYQIELVLANPSTTESTTVDVAIKTGNAEYLENFTTKSVEFLANETEKSVSITINNDEVYNSNKVIVFELTNVSQGAEVGSQSEFTLTIEEDEEKPLTEENYIIITQFYEGSSNNKYIELYNTSENPIDMGKLGLQLARWKDKQIESGAPSNKIKINGTIAGKSTYILKNSSAVTSFMIGDSENNSAVVFNGKDAVALLNKDDQILDVGYDGTKGEDESFVRKREITKQSITYKSEQWDRKELSDVKSAANDRNEKTRLPY